LSELGCERSHAGPRRCVPTLRRWVCREATAWPRAWGRHPPSLSLRDGPHLEPLQVALDILMACEFVVVHSGGGLHRLHPPPQRRLLTLFHHPLSPLQSIHISRTELTTSSHCAFGTHLRGKPCNSRAKLTGESLRPKQNAVREDKSPHTAKPAHTHQHICTHVDTSTW
jgi:hypothetical protein